MKTLAISTLAMLSIACAPDANIDHVQAQDTEMAQSLENDLDDALARTNVTSETLQRAKKEFREINIDMNDAGLSVIGMLEGKFDDRNNTFKAVGFNLERKALFTVYGTYTWTEGMVQERVLDGMFIASMDPDADVKVTHPEHGVLHGETNEYSYHMIQIAEGFEPLFHEGLWIESSESTTGHFIGLFSRAE